MYTCCICHLVLLKKIDDDDDDDDDATTMTCDHEIKGSTCSQTLLCSNVGPVIHTCGPLSQSSISWQWPNGNAPWLER